VSFLNIYISWGVAAFIICVLTLAIILHEFGHWFYIYRHRNIKMRFKVFKEKGISNFGVRQFDDTGQLIKKPLTNDEMKYVLMFGIIMGFIPILFGWIGLIKITILGWFLIPGYFAGCKRDFDKLIDIVKQETEVLKNGSTNPR
jgi:hypothetical protein